MVPPWALLSLVAAAVDVDAAATAETRAGRAPVAPGQPPQSTVISVVTPALGLEVGQYANRLRLQYGPRVSWVSARRPDPGRPFVMHIAEASLGLQPAATAAFNLRGRASTGDTDYTALTQIVGRTQSALPDVTGLTVIEGRAELGLLPSAAWQTETSVEVVYREPIFSAPAAGAPPPPPDPGAPADNPFPRHLSLEAAQTANHRVTRRDTLRLRLTVGHDSLSSGLRMLAISPTVGWEHALGRHDSIRGGGGVTVARQSAAPPGRPFDDGVSPLVDFALTSRLHNGRDVVVTSALIANVTWYLDPVLAISGPRGNLGASVELAFPPKWSMTPAVFFSTSLREDRAPGDPPPDETVVTFALPVRCRLSRNFDLEFGMSMSDRGPHLEVDGFGFHQFELWGYVMLSGRIGRDRPRPRASARMPADRTTGTAGALVEEEGGGREGGRDRTTGTSRTGTAPGAGASGTTDRTSLEGRGGPVRQSVTTRIGTPVYTPVTAPGAPPPAGSGTTDPAGEATRPGEPGARPDSPSGSTPGESTPAAPATQPPATTTPDVGAPTVPVPIPAPPPAPGAGQPAPITPR